MEEAYRALHAEVRAIGLYERTYLYYTLCATVAFSATILSVYAITVSNSILFQLLNAVFLGVALVQSGVIGHDLSHGQVFDSPTLNRLASTLIIGLFAGLSESAWYEKHNAHHESPNQLGHDPDVDMPFIFSEKQIPLYSASFKRWMLPYQHVLFFLLLPFMYIGMIAYSMRCIFLAFSVRKSIELLFITLHFFILIYIPFAYLPAGTALLFLLVVFGTSSVYLSLIFAPNHKGEEIIDADEQATWLHQITLTRNLVPGWFTFHFFAGLNYQVEHHLFPNMPRINYPKAHPIVKKFCVDNNIPFHETTWLSSMKEIYRALKKQAVIYRART